jgi:hypothetical protein
LGLLLGLLCEVVVCEVVVCEVVVCEVVVCEVVVCEVVEKLVVMRGGELAGGEQAKIRFMAGGLLAGWGWGVRGEDEGVRMRACVQCRLHSARRQACPVLWWLALWWHESACVLECIP